MDRSLLGLGGRRVRGKSGGGFIEIRTEIKKRKRISHHVRFQSFSDLI